MDATLHAVSGGAMFFRSLQLGFVSSEDADILAFFDGERISVMWDGISITQLIYIPLPSIRSV